LAVSTARVRKRDIAPGLLDHSAQISSAAERLGSLEVDHQFELLSPPQFLALHRTSARSV
jgi:hypothetical protein